MALQFTGRKEQLEQLDMLIKAKQGAVFAVSGNAGIGKSSLLKEVAGRYRKTGQVFIDINDVPPLQTATEFLQFFAKQAKGLEHTKKALAEINGTYKTTADLIAPYQELFKETLNQGFDAQAEEQDLTDTEKQKVANIATLVLKTGIAVWQSVKESKKEKLGNPELYLLKAIRKDCKQHPLIFIDTYERLQAAQELSQQHIKSLYALLNERLSPVSKALSLQDWLERLIDFLTANGAIVLIAGRRIARRDWKAQDLARFTDEEILDVVGCSEYADLQALLVEEQTEQALLSLLKRLSFDGIPLWLQLALNFVSVELATRTITELAALDNLEALFAEPLDSSELISANIDHASCKLALFERVMQHYSAELKAVAWKMALPRRLDKAVLTVLFAGQADTMREAFVRAGLLPSVRWEEGKQVALHQEIRDLLLGYAKYKNWLEMEETTALHQQLAELFAQRYQQKNDIQDLLEQLYHQLMGDGNADLSHFQQPDVLFEMSLAFQAEKQYQKMLQVMLRLVDMRPNSEKEWFGLGVALVNLQHDEEAIASYDKAIEIKADYENAWFNRGVSLSNLQRYEEAISSYDKVLAIKADDYQAWSNRGLSLERLQRYEEAIASHDKVLTIKADDYHARFDRGWNLEKLQRYEEAIASYDKAIEIKADCYQAWNRLALIYWKLSDFTQAQQAYANSLAIKPENSSTLSNDAELALIQQDKNRCLQRIQQALPLVDNKDQRYAILPFLAWLAEPENSYQPILTAIAQLDSGVKITWDFTDTEPTILRLTPQQQTIARQFIAYFQGQSTELPPQPILEE